MQVNGTGRVISSDVVSGRRCYESGVAQQQYERFANGRTSRDSSTPKREEKRKWRQGEKRAEDRSRKEERWSDNARYKHLSTVSLPNYDELDTRRHRSRETELQQDEFESRPRRPVRSSTVSLPPESFLSPFSEVRNHFPTDLFPPDRSSKTPNLTTTLTTICSNFAQKTSVRLEDYVPRSDNLSPYQVIEKLSRANGMVKEYEYVKYDSRRGEEHWELSDIGYSEIQVTRSN